jgi:4-hydroxy-3-polyprenylbenzoate decarboxylase
VNGDAGDDARVAARRAGAPAAGAVALLVTGASGMRLPLRVLRVVAASPGVTRLHLVVSAGASQVLRHELGETATGARALVAASALPPADEAKVVVHRDSELDAPISSGSYRLAGTVVLPCSGATLGALATGAGTTLVHRAGAVALKERWPLVLGFRETPLSIVHLENLRRLAYAGAVVLPPIPAFYVQRAGGETGEDRRGGELSADSHEGGSGDASPGRGEPETLERFLDAYALRVLDHLGLPAMLPTALRWGEHG